MALSQRRFGAQKPTGTHPRVNRDHPLARGLVAFFVLNEYGAPVLYDAVSGMQVPLSGGATWGSQSGRSGLITNVANATATLTTPADLQIQPPLTLLWRGVLNGGETSSANVFGVWHNNTQTAPYTAYTLKYDFWPISMTLDFNAAGTETIVSASGTAPTGQVWLAGTIQSGSQAVYQNNPYVASGTSATSISTIQYGASTQVGFGGQPGINTANTNALHEYGTIYNRVLSTQELAWWYYEPWAVLLRPSPPRFYSIPSATSFGTSDTEALASFESPGSTATFSATDAEAVGATESNALTAQYSASDNEALASSEAPSITSQLPGTDTEALANIETQALSVSLSASDSTAVASGESIAISVATNASDSETLAASESGIASSVSALAALISTDAPISWWRLGETSGTSAADIGSLRNNGTYSGGYTLNQYPLVYGDPNPSTLFNGSTAYVTSPDNAAYTITNTNKLTVVAFVMLTAAPSGVVNVVTKGNSGNYEWALRFNGTSAEFVVWTSSGSTIISALVGASTIFTNNKLGRIVMLAATFDNSLTSNPLQVFFDTVQTGSGTPSGAITHGTAPVDIGRRDDATGYLNGYVQDVAIFNTVLTPARLAQYVSAMRAALVATDSEALVSSESGVIGTNTITANDSEAIGSSELAAQSVVYSGWSSVTDTFDTPANWYYGAGSNITGGQGVLTPSTTAVDTESIQSVTLHDLTNASVSLQIVQPLAQVSGARTIMEMRSQGLGNNTVAIQLENGQISLVTNLNGTYTGVVTATYDSANMGFWRWRESGGVLYADTSPDATTWTNLGSFRYLGTHITVTDMQVNISAQTWKVVSNAGTMIVDNLNVVIVSFTPSDSSPVTSTESQVISAVLTGADTEAASSTEASSTSTTQSAADTEALASIEASSVVAQLASTDSGAFTEVEAEALAIQLASVDSDAITSAESPVSSALLTASDTTAIVSGESVAISVLTSASDSQALASIEALLIAVQFASTDSGILTSIESSTFTVAFPASETSPVTSGESALTSVGVVTSDSETFAVIDTPSIVATMSTIDGDLLTPSETSVLFASVPLPDATTIVSVEVQSSTQQIALTDTVGVVSSENVQSSAPVVTSDSTPVLSSNTATLTSLSAANDSEALVSIEAGQFSAQLVANDSEALASVENVVGGIPITTSDTAPVTCADSGVLSATLAQSDTQVFTSGESNTTTTNIQMIDASQIGSADTASSGSPTNAQETSQLASVEFQTSNTNYGSGDGTLVRSDDAIAAFSAVSISDATVSASSEQCAISRFVVLFDAAPVVSGETASYVELAFPVQTGDASSILTADDSAPLIAFGSSDSAPIWSNEWVSALVRGITDDTTLLNSDDQISLVRLTAFFAAEDSTVSSTEFAAYGVIVLVAEVVAATGTEALVIFGGILAIDTSGVLSIEVPIIPVMVPVSDASPVLSGEIAATLQFAGKGYHDFTGGPTRADVVKGQPVSTSSTIRPTRADTLVPGRRSASTTAQQTSAGTVVRRDR